MKRKMRVVLANSSDNFGSATGGPGSLEQLLRSILAATPVPRGFKFDDKSVYLLHEEVRQDGVSLHLVTYKSGDAVTAINDPGQGHPNQLDAVPPPTNKQYISSTYLVHVWGNNAIICRSGANTDAPMISWVWQAAIHLGTPHTTAMFELKNRAHVNKLASIQAEGIKSLKFNGAASLGAVQQANRTSTRENILGAVVDQFRSTFGAGMGQTLASSTKVEVKLSIDQRTASLAHDPLVLAAATQALQDGDDGFQIVTASGKQFTAEDVLLSKDVDMSALGNHPDHVSGWAALKSFRNDL